MAVDDTLRCELLQRAERDQRVRAALEPYLDADDINADPAARRAIAELGAIDASNTAWLRSVVDAIGWPGRSLVGVDGAQCAWLLAQHADRDPAFQRRCLELMEVAATGEVDPAHPAYLTDRVRLAEHLPQVYGTQVELVDGEWRPRWLFDPDVVDQRRAAVGLEPIAEYLASFRSPVAPFMSARRSGAEDQ